MPELIEHNQAAWEASNPVDRFLITIKYVLYEELMS